MGGVRSLPTFGIRILMNGVWIIAFTYFAAFILGAGMSAPRYPGGDWPIILCPAVASVVLICLRQRMTRIVGLAGLAIAMIAGGVYYRHCDRVQTALMESLDNAK